MLWNSIYLSTIVLRNNSIEEHHTPHNPIAFEFGVDNQILSTITIYPTKFIFHSSSTLPVFQLDGQLQKTS